MEITRLAELFLTKLYDCAQQHGFDRYWNLRAIATEFGVTDAGKVRAASDYIKARGLARVEYYMGGGVDGMLTGDGAVFVERGGETGVIQQFRTNPQAFIANITIHGNVSGSNIAAASPHASQRVTVDPSIAQILDCIQEAFGKDATLDEEIRNDAINDVEQLRLEAGKAKKDEGWIRKKLEALRSLTTLANMAQVGSLIVQLWQCLFPGEGIPPSLMSSGPSP